MGSAAELGKSGLANSERLVLTNQAAIPRANEWIPHLLNLPIRVGRRSISVFPSQFISMAE
jgi:hypothetical protein